MVKKDENTGECDAGRKQRMPISQRAKQFMPFAAVTGLDEALRQKELELEELTDRMDGEHYEEWIK